MKKQNGIRAVLWTVLMLAAVLTGCCADGEDACTLDPANPARFTCGGGGIYYAAGGCTA